MARSGEAVFPGLVLVRPSICIHRHEGRYVFHIFLLEGTRTLIVSPHNPPPWERKSSNMPENVRGNSQCCVRECIVPMGDIPARCR